MHRILTILLLTSACYGQAWVGHTEVIGSAPSDICSPGVISVDTVGQAIYVCPSSGHQGGPIISSGTIPSGLISLVVSGACPAGFTEVSALNGKMLRGTVAANNDVGTTGGSATITPTGTVSQPTFTGNSGTVPAETFTGSTTTVPAETVNSLTAAAPVITGVPGLGTLANSATATSGNCATTNIAAGTGSATACKATAPNLTVPAEGHTGALTAGTLANGTSAVTGTLNSTTLTPLGSNSTTTFTPAGSVSQPTFTGAAIDPSPSYVKVIFCSKN